MENLDKFVERAAKAEEEIAVLLKELEDLESKKPNGDAPPSGELEKLKQENTKLKYRLGILKRATANESKPKPVDESKLMLSVHDLLRQRFSLAIAEAFPDVPDPPCPIDCVMTVAARKCDYQFNGAMPLSGILKGQGLKVPPRDVADKVVSCLDKGDEIEEVVVAGPGFVNITLNKNFVAKQVVTILLNGVRPPSSEAGKKQKIVVDFSSPNIAKEMHVGHLRSTIIGEAICRLFEFLNHDVLRLNHLGDWGTQFGMLIAHLQDKFPNFKNESPPIGDLMAFYKESKTRFDEDEKFKARAYSSVVKLQSFDPDHTKAWNLICDVSRKEFNKIYERLNVTLQERGESFYQKKMEAIVKELKERKVLQEDNGRLIMFVEGISVPLTIVKSDGGFTYDTSDMAAIQHRITEEKADRIVYVTDAGQGPHLQTVFEAARQLGWLGRDRKNPRVRTDHVGFGVVLGEDKKKFKTRSGDTVRLVDLLDEGLSRAQERIVDKAKDRGITFTKEEAFKTAEAIAYSCIKYADLCHNRNHEYVFSFDKMLEDKGNTAVYMLYAYTRIKSIGRTLGSTEWFDNIKADPSKVDLDHEKELKLAKLLLRFPEIISKISNDLFLHALAEFMYEVATAFSEFYDTCYCVEKDRKTGEIVKVNEGRVALCEATATVLAKSFYVLGIEPVEKM